MFVWAKIRTWDLRSIYMGWFSPYEVGIGLRSSRPTLRKPIFLNKLESTQWPKVFLIGGTYKGTREYSFLSLGLASKVGCSLKSVVHNCQVERKLNSRFSQLWSALRNRARNPRLSSELGAWELGRKLCSLLCRADNNKVSNYKLRNSQKHWK